MTSLPASKRSNAFHASLIIIKVSVDQQIISPSHTRLQGIAEAIALNSVPWENCFPNGSK